MQEYTIGEGDDTKTFEGKQLDEKILGTGPDDTKKIAYYKTLEGKYFKHTIHGINKDDDEQEHEISEVSSFEIP
mgnify:FL=1